MYRVCTIKTMKLFHTSPAQITTITKNGLFDDCLCFAKKPYFMSNKGIIYAIDLDESEIISAETFFNHVNYKSLDNIVAHVSQLANCDIETAQDLLTNSVSYCDLCAEKELEFDTDIDFAIQAAQAQCAKKLGYRAVQTRDEQGSLYLVSMLNKENELVRVDENSL